VIARHTCRFSTQIRANRKIAERTTTATV